VSRVLLIHDGTSSSHDLFQSVLTMLDPLVTLGLAVVPAAGLRAEDIEQAIRADQARAKQLGREVPIAVVAGEPGHEIARMAREGHYDLIVAPLPEQLVDAIARSKANWLDYLLEHAHCPVSLTAPPAIPMEVDDDMPPAPANPGRH
jgi:Universal stress protein family